MKIIIKRNGITLIALIIIIIIMLILVGLTLGIIYINSIITNTKKAKFETLVVSLNENLQYYKLSAKMDNYEYTGDKLFWDGIKTPENTAKITDGINEDNIEKILGKIPTIFKEKLSIKNGEIIYHKFDGDEKKWLEELNYKVVTEEDNNLVTFEPGEITIEGLNIKIDDEGIITLNGMLSNNRYFVKLSNGIEANALGEINANEIFSDWMSKTEKFANNGQIIEQQVSIISGTYNITGDAQLNSAIRTRNNLAILNCKFQENNFNATTILNSDAVIPYLYIAKGNSTGSVECNNLKFKINIYGKQIEEINQITNMPMFEEHKAFNNFSCSINSDMSITLNGPVTNKTFLKFTGNIERKIENMSDTTWVDAGTVMAKKGDKIKLTVQYLGGDFSANNSKSEFNCVLRNKSNITVANIKFNQMKFENNKISTEEITLTNDITVGYLFFTSDIVCNNYTFIPKIEFIQ